MAAVRGRPFQRGKSGNPTGRPKGSENVRTREIRAVWDSWLRSGEYVASLKRRILAGRAPHMESYLAMLCWGRPKDVIETTGELVIKVEQSDGTEIVTTSAGNLRVVG